MFPTVFIVDIPVPNAIKVETWPAFPLCCFVLCTSYKERNIWV